MALAARRQIIGAGAAGRSSKIGGGAYKLSAAAQRGQRRQRRAILGI